MYGVRRKHWRKVSHPNQFKMRGHTGMEEKVVKASKNRASQGYPHVCSMQEEKMSTESR